MGETIAVTQMLDIPETGGRADEIGGHVELADAEDIERITCPRCGRDITKQTVGHGCNGEHRSHPAGEPGAERGRWE